jgi:hypothetical protein
MREDTLDSTSLHLQLRGMDLMDSPWTRGILYGLDGFSIDLMGSPWTQWILYGLDGCSMVMLFRHIHFAVGDVFVFGEQLEGELDRTRCQAADSCKGNL